jgi:hypothetical protein
MVVYPPTGKKKEKIQLKKMKKEKINLKKAYKNK